MGLQRVGIALAPGPRTPQHTDRVMARLSTRTPQLKNDQKLKTSGQSPAMHLGNAGSGNPLESRPRSRDGT